ncbi:MAG: hemerythrin domain-containing protein [Thermoplasmata archaeon]
MKMDKMIEILKKFDEGKKTEKEILEQLEGTDPFYFYAAIIELYDKEDIRLDRGDSPVLSKLFQKLFKDDLNKLIKNLEEGHPIKELIYEHEQFETLLDMLKNMTEDIEDKPDPKKIERIENITDALKHLNTHFKIEEECIFPAWHEKEGWDHMDSFLLEEEHSDILKSYEKLTNVVNEKEKNVDESWKDLSELVDKLIGELSFHVFHEGDIFYPIMVDQLSTEKSEEIKAEIGELKDENFVRSLDEYINYLSDLSLNEDEDKI